MITPVNGHIQITPIKEGGVVQRETSKYEEKGTVVNTGAVVYADFHVGDIVYFDGWKCAKYNEGQENEMWLLEHIDVRAVERS